MRLLWCLYRSGFRFMAAPLVWDEGLKDYRAQAKRTHDGQLVVLALEADSVEGARRLVPVGNVFRSAELIVSDGDNRFRKGDVMVEWWGEPALDGAQPRRPMPSLPIRPLEISA